MRWMILWRRRWRRYEIVSVSISEERKKERKKKTHVALPLPVEALLPAGEVLEDAGIEPVRVTPYRRERVQWM